MISEDMRSGEHLKGMEVEGQKTKECAWGAPPATIKGPRIFKMNLGKKNTYEGIFTWYRDLLQSYGNLDGVVLA